jgi:rhamnosyltransferase
MRWPFIFDYKWPFSPGRKWPFSPGANKALGSTRLNLLFDVGFNKEVGQDAALYWSKQDGDLAGLIGRVDGFEEEVLELES